MSRSIPLDIQLEIIKRLPVKSLIRFISVCKAWKSLIKCPEFVAGYRVLPTQPHHLLITYEPDEVKFVHFVDDDTFPQQKLTPTVPPIVQLLDELLIIGSSCGLLCLEGLFREPDNSQTDMVVLWNPSIRKSIAVAVPNMLHRSFNSVLGFGVCPYTNDPKLVKITYISDYQKMESISCIPNQVMVFTLSSREWTTPCSSLPHKSIKFSGSQTVIGQFIYWLAYAWIAVDGKYRNLIMSFDMSTEEIREVDLPDSLAYVFQADLSVSRVRESLVLLENSINTSNRQVCDVWMMDHGDSKAFTKLFTINSSNASVSRTLAFRKSGEPIVEMQDNHQDFETPCAVVVYEPCSEHIRDLGIRGDRWSVYGGSYTDSLLLLDHDDDGHIVRVIFSIEDQSKQSKQLSIPSVDMNLGSLLDTDQSHRFI